MKSLRGRLVLGLLAGITLFLALTGLAVHQVVETRLSEGLDATLEAVLRSSVNDVVREQDRRPPLDSRRRSPRGKSFLGWLLPEQEDVLLQAWGEDGTTLFRSEALGEEELPRLARELDVLPLGDLGEAEPYRAELQLPGTATSARAMAFRYVTRGRNPPGDRSPRGPGALRGRAGRRGPPPGPGDGPGPPRERDAPNVGDGGPFDRGDPLEGLPDTGREEPRIIELVVAHDTTGLDETMSELRWLLALGWLVSSVGCAGIVSWIVHVGLRPLGRLRDQMGRHGADDLQRPFQLPDAPRELAPVVAQLNDLMGRIGGAFEREQAFASDAAHELRTPLAGLRATLELALSRPRESESLRATAETSLAITLEMEALVATLLDLARVSAQSRRPAQAVDVPALLDASWSAHAAVADVRGLRLESRVPSKQRLSTDAALLGRVLDNLVENAVTYAAPTSSIEVAVEAAEAPDAGEWRLSITNRVQDPDPQLAERALQAFWRADGSRSDTGRHAGLGLPLCRRIVETLGGTLEAQLDGERFTVRVLLPLK